MRHSRVAQLLPLLLVAASTPVAAQNAPEARSQAALLGLLPSGSGTQRSGPVSFDYEQLAFRRGSGDSVLVWAAVNVDASRLTPRLTDSGWYYSVSLSYELSQDGRTVSAVDSLDYVHPRILPDDQGLALQVPLKVAPGSYDFRITVTDRNRKPSPDGDDAKGSVSVPRFQTPGPTLSPLAVASDSPGPWRPARGIRLKLNAANVVETGAHPFVYFEVYGLTPGEGYRAQVSLSSIESQGFLDRVVRGRLRPFQLQYRGTAPEETEGAVRAAVRLDLASTAPGWYSIEVTVTDASTGQQSLASRTFLVVRESKPEIAVPQENVLGAGSP